MPDYENGKIYKLVSPHTDEIYIGSTCQKLCNRMSGHSRDFRKFKNKYTSAKLFELGDVQIILIEDCPCDRKEQLLKRERFHIEQNNCVNKSLPGRNHKEWREDNKEILKQKRKERVEKNKDFYLEVNKKCYNKLREKRLKEKKQYYEKNIEKMKEKETCECGSTFIKRAKARHEKTIKHQKHLLQN